MEYQSFAKAGTEGWIQLYQGFGAHYSMQEHLWVPSKQLFQGTVTTGLWSCHNLNEGETHE